MIDMNDHRLPARNKALIAAYVAIGIAGLLLRPIYPKSIFVALFLMSVFGAAYLIFWSRMTFQEWKQLPTLQKRLLFMIFVVALGGFLCMIYLTLRSTLR
ncbi:hypothetical protein X759_25325 [Mesorhizobium sp. LSHC420B00]|nr:hypothetical protein X759_25325 [Mesorhizobium sp. LSHC420B00]